MSVVLDASVALSWCLPGEFTAVSAAALQHVLDDGGLVTPLWSLEVVNVLLVKERRGVLTPALSSECLMSLERLPLENFDLDPPASTLLVGARVNGLSAYDASYLWAAMTSGLPLATLDAKLAQAARDAGVRVIGE